MKNANQYHCEVRLIDAGDGSGDELLKKGFRNR